MRTIRIYDKTVPVLLTINTGFLVGVVGFILVGSWKFFDLGGFLYLSLFFIAFCGVQSILRTMHHQGSFGPISRLSVTDTTLSLFGTTWNHQDIDTITIDLWCREIQDMQYGNNYMKITTKTREVYELAVLIENDKDVRDITETITLLRKKMRVEYRNRLPKKGSLNLVPIDI